MPHHSFWHPLHPSFPSTGALVIPIHCTVSLEGLCFFSLLGQILPCFPVIYWSCTECRNQCFIHLDCPAECISSIYLNFICIYSFISNLSSFLKLFLITTGNNDLSSLTISHYYMLCTLHFDRNIMLEFLLFL